MSFTIRQNYFKIGPVVVDKESFLCLLYIYIRKTGTLVAMFFNGLNYFEQTS